MKLSFIIPAYNEQKDVGRLLDCLLPLNFNREIIVSDDASTDKTVEVLNGYKNKIKILANKERHKSIAANRNAGAKIADGDFLIFMDATTFIKDPDDFFKRAILVFEKNKEIVAITGKLTVLPELESLADKVAHLFFNSTIMLKNNFLGMAEASGKFQMIKKTAFEKVGGFNENLVTREDADMFCRLSKIGKVRYINSLHIFYTGRRAHILGWSKLLFIWIIETIWVFLFGKNILKEWKPIR